MAIDTKELYEDANNDYLIKNNAVESYGGFITSDRLNNIQNVQDSTLDSMLNYGEFNSADLLADEAQKKQNAENAVANYGDFTYGKQDVYDDVMDKILNGEKFTYDVNGDALYQQYKDQYMTQGEMAMMDTMGQAAAMTGGYGNSYAQNVGQQAYQGYLQQLNDKVPELYKLALDKYSADRQDLYNQYSMLSSDRSTQYGEWSDGYNRTVADRDYYANNYNNAYNQKYGEWADGFNMLGTIYDAATNAYNSGWNQENSIWQSGYDRLVDQRDSAFNYAVQMANNDHWQQEFDEMVRMNDAEITTKAQQNAANDCYAAIEQGVMPSDDMIQKAGLNKATVTKMVNERKTAIDLDNNAKRISNQNAQAAYDYSGYINPDDVEVDENGNITSIKGYNISGDKSVASAQTGTVSGFKSKTGDNFKVTINGTTYKVENDGKVSDKDIVKALDSANANDNTIVSYQGDMYVKSGGAYYKVGSRNLLFEFGTANNDLYNLAKNMK